MNRKNNVKHEIEYEEAPSGNVTFYNYKVPLMKYTKGFGFIGALVFDTETDQVQCHICGGWFISLPRHINFIHHITAKEYKEEVGLLKTTALIGERLRAKLIASGLDKRLQNLRQNQAWRKNFKMKEVTKEKIRKTLRKNVALAEHQNLRGVCPEQLIDRLQTLYKEKGNTFHSKHIPMEQALINVFGSVREACRIAGVPLRKPGQTARAERVQEFRKFNDEQLLDFLKRFKEKNGRKPSLSDSKRALIPSANIYKYKWGSLEKAVNLALK